MEIDYAENVKIVESGKTLEVIDGIVERTIKGVEHTISAAALIVILIIIIIILLIAILLTSIFYWSTDERCYKRKYYEFKLKQFLALFIIVLILTLAAIGTILTSVLSMIISLIAIFTVIVGSLLIFFIDEQD